MVESAFWDIPQKRLSAMLASLQFSITKHLMVFWEATAAPPSLPGMERPGELGHSIMLKSPRKCSFLKLTFAVCAFRDQ